MSRIGKQPIVLGAATATIGDTLKVKGPKGELDLKIIDGITVKTEDGQLIFSRDADTPNHRAKHGLMRALAANMVTGVTKGFEKRLEVIGVGYKAQVSGKKLVMNLGFSHPIEYMIPNGISISVEKNTKLIVQGISKEAVGQTAAVLRGYRPPDSYRGKGVRYEGEHIKLKAGKSAKS
jgi:large subunit ribosomal protein L6